MLDVTMVRLSEGCFDRFDLSAVLRVQLMNLRRVLGNGAQRDVRREVVILSCSDKECLSGPVEVVRVGFIPGRIER